MSVSPASLMRRIYYATILLALIAGGMYFAATLRYGWAETQEAFESLFLPENEISIPADFPSDVPVYDPTKISVTLYGFDYSGGKKAHRLNYRLDTGVSFNTVASYYRQTLKSQGWMTGEAQSGQGPVGSELVEFATFTSEKAGAKLTTHVSTQKGGLDVEMRYVPKDMRASSSDDEGANLPEDFPNIMPAYASGGLFSYEVSSDRGSNRYKAYLQVPGSEASLADLKDFYMEWVLDEGWKKTKESSINKEYIVFSDGVRELQIVIQPVAKSGSQQQEAVDFYQIVMETGPLSSARPSGTNKNEVSLDEIGFEPLNLPDFEDLPNGYGYAPAIKELKAKGVLKGYADGTFKPGNPVNRAEFVKTIVEALGEEPAGDACFEDVDEEWFAKYACHAKKEGIIGGYPDGTFGPGRNVNYAEAVKIAMLAFGKMEEGDEGGWEWYDKYFNAALERGYLRLIESITEDDPNTPISRGQMAQLIFNLGFENADSTYDPKVWEAKVRNDKRNADMNTYLNAISQYAIYDGKGLPVAITTTPTSICASGAASCSGQVDLSVLTANGKYLVTLPADPTAGTPTSTGYLISKDSDGRVTVSAPHAEQGVKISITR